MMIASEKLVKLVNLDEPGWSQASGEDAIGRKQVSGWKGLCSAAELRPKGTVVDRKEARLANGARVPRRGTGGGCRDETRLGTPIWQEKQPVSMENA